MTKGQDQAAAVADICRDVAGRLAGGEAGPLGTRLAAQAKRLDVVQHRLFLKMGGALKFTEPCLAAAEKVKADLDAGAGAADLESAVAALEEAVAALEKKSMSPGSIIIT